MFRSEYFFADSQSAFIEWHAVASCVNVMVDSRQIVERTGCIEMLLSESFFADSQSAFVERFGGGVIADFAALIIVMHRQIVER